MQGAMRRHRAQSSTSPSSPGQSRVAKNSENPNERSKIVRRLIPLYSRSDSVGALLPEATCDCPALFAAFLIGSTGGLDLDQDDHRGAHAVADQAIVILEARLDITVVSTDVQMPGSMDGLKLAASIRGVGRLTRS
jgi:hypothetical protein